MYPQFVVELSAAWKQTGYVPWIDMSGKLDGNALALLFKDMWYAEYGSDKYILSIGWTRPHDPTGAFIGRLQKDINGVLTVVSSITTRDLPLIMSWLFTAAETAHMDHKLHIRLSTN